MSIMKRESQGGKVAILVDEDALRKFKEKWRESKSKFQKKWASGLLWRTQTHDRHIEFNIGHVV